MNEEHTTDHARQIPSDFGEGLYEQAQSESGHAPPTPSSQPAVEERMQRLIEERDAAKVQALRAQAELENFRKRTNRERDEERRYAAIPLVRDLLPGLDNLQRAIDAARHTDDLSAMLQGVEMVSAQIHDVLTRHGAVPIPSVGEPFDPNKHEAIQQMPSSDHPPMTVLSEVECGYTLNERVVRPSKVIVSITPPSA